MGSIRKNIAELFSSVAISEMNVYLIVCLVSYSALEEVGKDVTLEHVELYTYS